MVDPEAKFPENHAHGGYGVLNYSLRARKTADNYEKYMGWNETKVAADDDQDSGVITPPLWRSSSPPGSPQNRANHYRSLSPSSKAQAIARGQKELMELASRMPEGSYELTLKDLVEQAMVEPKQESFSSERSVKNEGVIQRKGRDLNRNEKKVQMNRSGSFDNGGLFLKMVFPVSWGSRKRKKGNSSATNNSSKEGRMSPKPLLGDGSARSSLDNEWWKIRDNEPGETESGGGLSSASNSRSSKSSGSSSSRSSSRNSSRQKGGGCWCCIFPWKAKSAG